MFGKRIICILVAALAVAACGGGTPPGAGTAVPAATAATAPTAPTTATTAPGASVAPAESVAPAASVAPAVSVAPASAGSMTITLGSATKVYAITLCTTTNGTLWVQAGDPATDGAGLTVNLGVDGKPIVGANANISGTFAGQSWYGPPSATWDGKQGTFSGTDSSSQQEVTGSFSCP